MKSMNLKHRQTHRKSMNCCFEKKINKNKIQYNTSVNEGHSNTQSTTEKPFDIIAIEI